jgi:hypothetical protein
MKTGRLTASCQHKRRYFFAGTLKFNLGYIAINSHVWSLIKPEKSLSGGLKEYLGCCWTFGSVIHEVRDTQDAIRQGGAIF